MLLPFVALNHYPLYIAAGLPAKKQQIHALKHTIGTYILDARENMYFAKDWLGHKSNQNSTICSMFSTAAHDARARKMIAVIG